jgi:hypothetical protein
MCAQLSAAVHLAALFGALPFCLAHVMEKAVTPLCLTCDQGGTPPKTDQTQIKTGPIPHRGGRQSQGICPYGSLMPGRNTYCNSCQCCHCRLAGSQGSGRRRRESSTTGAVNRTSRMVMCAQLSAAMHLAALFDALPFHLAHVMEKAVPPFCLTRDQGGTPHQIRPDTNQDAPNCTQRQGAILGYLSSWITGNPNIKLDSTGFEGHSWCS